WNDRRGGKNHLRKVSKGPGGRSDRRERSWAGINEGDRGGRRWNLGGPKQSRSRQQVLILSSREGFSRILANGFQSKPDAAVGPGGGNFPGRSYFRHGENGDPSRSRRTVGYRRRLGHGEGGPSDVSGRQRLPRFSGEKRGGGSGAGSIQPAKPGHYRHDYAA